MDPAPQTDPNAKAWQTLEGKLTVGAIVIGAVLSAASTAVGQLHTQFPEWGFAAAAVGVVAGVAAVVLPVLKLITARTGLKQDLLRADTMETLIGAGIHPAQLELARIQAVAGTPGPPA